MLKELTDAIARSAISTVKARVTKIVKIDAGSDVKVDVDVRAMTPLAGDPVSVVTLDETSPIAIEPGRYVVIAVFMRLP